MTERITYLPIISTTQNGPGGTTHDTIIEDFDTYGNPIQDTDERGIVHKYTLAGPILGAVTTQVLKTLTGLRQVKLARGGSHVKVNITETSL
jgi:hypothetical protein